jgi:hypothetical protein
MNAKLLKTFSLSVAAISSADKSASGIVHLCDEIWLLDMLP